MKVLVAGEHGKTARRLVRILTEDGHEVRGLVRKEEQMPDVEADGAEAVLVDLEEEEVEGRIEEAVEGCDAIVFAAGAGPGSGAARKETMDYGGAVKLVEAAERRGGEALSDAQLDGCRQPGGWLGGDAAVPLRQGPRRRAVAGERARLHHHPSRQPDRRGRDGQD